ncbi:ABC transporter permease [Vallitalea sp.]|jgi:putative aldouronate transport system permease protein|uniref:ABC transporter permease n=1 Tax=Vallitalea sp. TaxID=1882829 RepID=UPI0025F503A9|nr:ABC transporter permease subunit [Vallitalea sp.]MCT4688716.1 ABC transporter permease subunit [Vallitalea sp.]
MVIKSNEQKQLKSYNNSSNKLLKYIKKNKWLYILLIPGLMYFILFRYVPILGLIIAFKDYDIFKGIFDSAWVGFDNFRVVFGSSDFKKVFSNTMVISLLKILIGFPVPIILALMLNEMKNFKFKRMSQTVLYLPHFLSWVVIGGIMLNLFSPSYGVVGEIFRLFGMEPVNLLASKKHFRSILIISDIWKESGWGTIVYLAALTQIDPNLYEAANIDGASKWKQTIHITLPAISGIIVMLLILRIGRVMNAGFQQIMVLQTPLVQSISDIFDTYVYRNGLTRGQYSIAATVDMFKSVVALLLVVTTDKISKRIGEEGLL